MEKWVNSQAWWCAPVVLATQGVDSGRLHRDPVSKTTFQNENIENSGMRLVV